MHQKRINFTSALLTAVAVAVPVLAAQDEPSNKAIHRDVADQANQAAAEERALQVSAATTDGLETLRRDVLATPFDTERTIDQMVRRLDAGSALSKAVQSADQLGSPRYREDRVCEVRLILPGNAVADALEWAATQKHVTGQAGLPDVFKAGIARLRKRTFAATGVARAAAGLERVRPDLSASNWQQVPDADRTRAVDAARLNAVATVLESVSAVSLGDGRTLRDALAVQEVAEPIKQWLSARPISDVEFRNDLKVRVILAAPADDLWPVIKAALIKNKFGPSASDTLAWDKIRTDLGRAVPAAEGRGVAAVLAPTTQPLKTPQTARIPMDAPQWASRQLVASTSVGEPGLRGAHKAQADAQADIRRQIEQLPLTGTQTLGEAARIDPRIARVIDDTVQRSKIANVTYHPASVNVRLVLELELLWRPLSRLD